MSQSSIKLQGLYNYSLDVYIFKNFINSYSDDNGARDCQKEKLSKF